MANQKSIMSRTIKWAIGAVVIFVIGVQIIFAGFYQNVSDLELKVIDSETKLPISGVVLVAFWEKWTSNVGGSNPAGAIAIKESISDSDGRVGYSGWKEWFPKEKFPPPYSPTLVLIAEDYKASILKNFGYEQPNTLFIVGEFFPLESKWNGGTVELERIEGGASEFNKANLEAFKIVSNLRDRIDYCLWDQIPRFFILDIDYSFRTRANKSEDYTFINSLESNYLTSKECSSFAQFVKINLQ